MKPTESPRTILLATDLSARCDRALDRAMRLAAEWGARLIALTVVEARGRSMYEAVLPSWRRPADPVEAAARCLRAELAAEAAEAVEVISMVEQGDPAEVIARVAGEHRCDLIVTGLGRDEILGRFSLGSTVDRLLRRSTTPILIIKNRAVRDYRNIVAAVDFSLPSRNALETGSRWFPGGRMALFHAHDLPFSGIMSDRDQYQREYREVARAQCAEFLADADLPAEARDALVPVIEHGEPAQLIRDYVQEFDVDLVVLGSRGRSAALDLLIGNTATEILARLACDALVVR